MPLNLPSDSEEIEDRLKSDVAQSAPDSNPYAANHWLLALIIGLGRRLFDYNRDLQRAVDFAFPDTTFEEGITRWAAIYGLAQNAATQSTGNAIANGVALSAIPINTLLSTTVTDTDGNSTSITYETTSATAISDNTISISDLNLSGQTVTADTDVPHELSNNVPVTISGAIEPEYNVADVEITVISPNSFTYLIEGSPSSPATGTIEANFTSATVPIKSQEFGSNTNLSSSTVLTLQSPLAGVNNSFGVDANGIKGGNDQESLLSLQEKLLQLMRNPIANFSVSDIEAIALEVSGVSRVFVQPAGSLISSFSITTLTNDTGAPLPIAKATTATPHGLFPGDFTTITGAVPATYNVVNEPVIVLGTTTFAYTLPAAAVTPAAGAIFGAGNVPLGSVRVYFITNNDEDVIPSPALVTDVFNKILTILPATTSNLDLDVLAPIAVPEDFTFTSLTPNTPTMQSAVLANLQQFFSEQVVVGIDVEEDAYRAAIIDTVDIETGERLQSFILAIPIGNLPIGTGEIATLGVVTFP